jgi:hypothetical protein
VKVAFAIFGQSAQRPPHSRKPPLQLRTLQLVPLHPTVPFGSFGQLEHAPLQFMKPLLQPIITQACPLQPTRPFATFGQVTQAPPQFMKPELQPIITQACPSQPTWPFATFGQLTQRPPHTRWLLVAHWLVEHRLFTQAKPLPHWLLSQQVPSTQRPPQFMNPWRQVVEQRLLTQVTPPVH